MSGTCMTDWTEKFALSTKILVAGGKIESRCVNPPEFVTHYVFTKEQLEKFIHELTKQAS